MVKVTIYQGSKIILNISIYNIKKLHKNIKINIKKQKPVNPQIGILHIHLSD